VPRIRTITRRGLAVTIALVASHASAAAEDGTDPAKELRLATRKGTPIEQRVAAVKRVLALGRTGDVDLAVHTAATLVAEAPIEAARLITLARDEEVPGEEALASARAAVLATLKAHALDAGGAVLDTTAERDAASAWFACGVAVGLVPPGAAETVSGDPRPDVLAVVRAAMPTLLAERVAGSATLAPKAADAERLLDRAATDDPKASRVAIDEALAATSAGDRAVVATLLAAATPSALPTPKGRVPRRVRAILILGLARVKEAIPALEASLDDKQPGWVRVAAANALGDIGDPSAVVALCRVLFYLGDIHRSRDAWDYPGGGNTDVPESEWSDVDYFSIDVAAADALLRLGVREAGGWIIKERLPVWTNRWRVRVLQDSVDAIRRAFPLAPKGYEPDGGVPQRDKAWHDLAAWWATGPRLAKPLDENDPGFRAAADGLVSLMGKKGVMDLQIAKRSAALLGAPMTPALLAGLTTSKSKVHRAELALVLGAVRDRRAVDPLLALTKDPVSNVRAAAAEALAPYVEGEKDPGFDGEAKDVVDRAVARWIEMLDDEEESPRASAMKGLVSAPKRPEILAAVRAHASATHPDNAFSDYVIAEEIVGYVQSGREVARLDAIVARLLARDLFVRRATWEHLVRALHIDPRLFDPTPDPDAAAGAAEALKKRIVEAEAVSAVEREKRTTREDR